MIVDLGTGDGRAVLREAAADPDAFVLGVDAEARVMAEASRRAARRRDRGGAGNARFIVSAVEHLPLELAGFADRVTVRLPWGTLLRGALGLDEFACDAIVRLVAPGGRLEIVVSLASGDAVDGAPSTFGAEQVGSVTEAFGIRGLIVTSARVVTPGDVGLLGSTWARRLRVGHERDAWRLDLRRQR